MFLWTDPMSSSSAPAPSKTLRSLLICTAIVQCILFLFFFLSLWNVPPEGETAATLRQLEIRVDALETELYDRTDALAETLRYLYAEDRDPIVPPGGP